MLNHRVRHPWNGGGVRKVPQSGTMVVPSIEVAYRRERPSLLDLGLRLRLIVPSIILYIYS